MGKMLTILLAAVLGFVAPSWANQIVQYAPGYIGSDVEFNILLTNNDNGAIYNSYDLELFNSLAVALFALPQNQSHYASLENMVADWTIGVVPGEVSDGWNVNAGNYNPVSIVNIDGDINIDYDGWYATQQDPNQDAMAVRLSIPLSQLDGNGNGWDASDPGDYSIEMNSTPAADMGVGHSGVFNYSAQGYEYGVALNGDGKIVQYAPGQIGSDLEFNVQLINNDNGAIYNSYDLYLFSSLAQALYELPHNQTNYTSVEDLVSDWSGGVVPGEVNTGWNATTGDYNPVEIAHGPFGYEEWLATQQNPDQDTMAIRFSIPLSQLDGNGNGWDASDPGDYSIEMNSTPTADMGIGIAGLDSWSAQGYEYGVALNGGSEPVAGRFEMVTMELGLPALTITNSPNTVTVIVQRCDEGLTDGDWQTITNLVPGTTQWTDETATGAWEQLYYRLTK